MDIEYKLVPVNGAARKGRYRAVIGNNNRSYGTEAVLREACSRSGLHVTPTQLRMYVEALLESMIVNTAQDGVRRTFGDYFTVRLDVRGSFAGSDTKIEGGEHAVLNLQPLGRFKEVGKTVQLVNAETRRRIMLMSVSSMLRPGIDGFAPEGTIMWGVPIIFRGRGLWPVVDGDVIEWSFSDEHGEVHSGTCGKPDVRGGGGKKGDVISVMLPWPEGLPDSAQKHMVTFTFRSHGGNPDAEVQSHSITAFVVSHSPPAQSGVAG